VDHNLYWPAPPKNTNAADSAPITGNPRFVHAAGRDFHLLSTSAAIDVGVPVAQVPVDKDGVTRPREAAYDVGAYEFVPALSLYATPGNYSLQLGWSVNTTLPVTSTWQIAYSGPLGDQPSPITGIATAARAYTLTGLTNYTHYTVALTALLGGTPIMSDTVTAMPTDRLMFLPMIGR
jgi:hypothetical protein